MILFNFSDRLEHYRLCIRSNNNIINRYTKRGMDMRFGFYPKSSSCLLVIWMVKNSRNCGVALMASLLRLVCAVSVGYPSQAIAVIEVWKPLRPKIQFYLYSIFFYGFWGKDASGSAIPQRFCSCLISSKRCNQKWFIRPKHQPKVWLNVIGSLPNTRLLLFMISCCNLSFICA